MKKTCFHYVWGLAISIGWTLNGCVSGASLNAELVKVETHGIHDELVYSSFLKSYEIVALSDSVPEALIKFPDRILFAEDRIFVVDKADNKLLMFDREGSFLKSTASMVGKGHNEYIRLMDVAMDKESRTLYVHCDAPYQIMVFDFDLNLKEVVQTDYYMDEVVADGRFIYGIRTLYRDETGFELVALERNRLQDTPRVLLSFAGGVPGRRTTGKSLMQAVDGAYVSFPFDTHVYKIRNAEVVETYNMDFGEEGPSKITICGHSPIPVNTIHIRFFAEDGREINHMAEFTQSDDYKEVTFPISGFTGYGKVNFIFMPGSKFDFDWFKFEA